MKMKRLVFALTLIFASVATFAQDANSNIKLKNKASELKNKGNAEYKAKNYAGALASFENYVAAHKEYMAVDKEAKEDIKTTYLMAQCARKIKDFDKCLTYLNACIAKNYKADASTYYVGYCYQKKSDDAKAREIFEKGLNDFATSRYAGHFRKKVTTYMNKDAAAIFNKANDIAATATGKESAVYLSIMKGAVQKYNKAKVEFDKVLKIDPKNKTAIASKKNIAAAIQAYEDYKAELAKQKK